PVPAGHVPRRLPGATDRPAHEDLAGRVPRPRRHPTAGRQPHDGGAARDRSADSTGAQLRQPVPVRGCARCQAGRDHPRAVDRGNGAPRDILEAQGVRGRNRDRHPAPAAQGGARQAVLRDVGTGGVPLHEADHPAQAAGQPAGDAVPGDRPRRRRRAGTRRDRADGGDRVSRAPVTLVLVPTELEARRLALRHAPLELCGFGLARAGVGAMHAIARHRPQRVVLAGVAGSYDAELAPVGAVLAPGLVRCHGVGVGDQTPADLGFADSDEAELDGQDGLALAVARASGSLDQARSRRAAEPRAVLEEMEGYAVALAAIVAEIPCTMLRAISNMAGDRDLAGWSLDPALDALRERLDSMLAS